MKIGWHIHPYGQEATHIPSQPISIEAFLYLLEKALSERGKLGENGCKPEGKRGPGASRTCPDVADQLTLQDPAPRVLALQTGVEPRLQETGANHHMACHFVI